MIPSQSQRMVDPLDPTAILPENQHPVFTIQSDLMGDSEIEKTAKLVLARFERIDLLVNAAVRSVWAPMIDTDRLLDSAEAQFRLNVLTPLNLSIKLARLFWRGRREENIRFNRNIMNVSSIAGINVYSDVGQSVYAASKAALNHLTRHMALEFGSIGVRVNAIAPNSFPGKVSTKRVAQSIVELDAGKVNGQVLVLDTRSRVGVSE
jgi:NAD(P)-dependent dehydrogenase (short-subunit alcohol dehydrogenase family)